MKRLFMFFLTVSMLFGLVGCATNHNLDDAGNIQISTESTVSTVPETEPTESTCTDPTHTDSLPTEPSIQPTESEPPNSTENSKPDDSNQNKQSVATIIQQYSGRWYLDGYSDVYVDVYKLSDGDILMFDGTNFSLYPHDFAGLPKYTAYPQKYIYENNLDGGSWTPSCGLFCEDMDILNSNLAINNITLGNGYIDFADKRFVRKQGTIDKYYNTCYYEALGTWYMHNCPDSVLNISIQVDYGVKDGAFVQIDTINFDLFTLSTDTSGFMTSDWGWLRTFWENCGISVKDGVLTVSNDYGTRTFYRDITDDPSATQPTEPPMDPGTEPTPTVPPTSEPTEPTPTDPVPTEPTIPQPTEPEYAGVTIITGTERFSDTTIEGDVYITSTGVATFTNVTVNGNVYCYGRLSINGCMFTGLYAYNCAGNSCSAYDGEHGKVTISGKNKVHTLCIEDDALDYAFSKWGKR